ncbi:MAG: two-component system response regulator [Candidatus Jettenia sp.]|uniref:Two-component response regulator n=1 Tax=Candidatus Jettenia caeni TaxID=247490 RepID=I3IIJ3_9BACT|nr:HD domain-containing phosphohydrolase [Candidatus Jettenia sp. AMX1]MBC6928225.1 two-component system response regulator [Candidatus Jettenia sp.]WKZ16857.1 MAG: response regulator [Candidatus Jettenia caeni]KAA0250012.1 MAG: two-component system response regulator [Candidatus Jettenia sp. AMX1]MCE7880494.1 two-component system response regulator [Candidatus Jettenia sp. AMX1]MCQ3926302.1 two-component system response regulator [Candidatus Jettenia sp.]
MEQKTKSANILVIDDDLGVRESLKMTLKDRYSVFTLSSVNEALNNLKSIKPEMIFLDIRMPKSNGLDFLKQMQSINSTIPIVMITAYPSSQTAITALRNGAFDYIIKPFNLSEIHAAVDKALNYRNELSKKDMLVYNLKMAVHKNFFSTAHALLLAIDAKDSYTATHSKNVSWLFSLVADELGMSKSKIEVLRYGAFLHDIGKIGVSDTVLMKPNYLTADEFLLMKRHPEIGYNILEPINFLKESLPIVRHHHEWYNGQGYPDGLKETEIPYEAAIFSIIDVYDALTSDRHYRKKFSHEKALEIITEGINTQFVPNLTEEVLTIIDKYYEISNENKQIDEFSEPGDNVQ